MGYEFMSKLQPFSSMDLYEHNLIPFHLILDCCDFSEWTWYQVLQLYCETGDVINPKPSLCVHIHLLDIDDLQYLLCLVRQKTLTNSWTNFSICSKPTDSFQYTMQPYIGNLSELVWATKGSNISWKNEMRAWMQILWDVWHNTVQKS